MVKYVKNIYRRLPFINELRQIIELLKNMRTMDELYMQQIYLQNNPRYDNPKRLLRYQYQVNSQNGEDGIIDEIFKRIGVTNKKFVEIGVGDGTENNTAFLMTKGWSGYWIDSFDFRKNIQKKYKISENVLKGFVTFVTRENISPIFEKLSIQKEFDILSIDIDQNTYYIWESLREYKPRVVVVEYNAYIPPEIDWKVNYDPNRTWDGTQNFGASLKAYQLLGEKFGYSLVGCDMCGVNAFFVRNDLLDDLFEAPFTSENHYEPFRKSLVYNPLQQRSLLDQ